MKLLLQSVIILCPIVWVLAFFGGVITAGYLPSPSDPPSYIVPLIILYASNTLIWAMPLLFVLALLGLRFSVPKIRVEPTSATAINDNTWPPPPSQAL